MAPNLRNVSLLTDESLADVGSFLRNKIPVAATSTTTTTTTTDSASYWDWPTADIADEAPVDLFSANHLEANLVKDAAAASVSAKAEASSKTIAAHDAYWSMEQSCEPEPAMKAPLHTATTVADNDAYWAEATHAPTSSDEYWAEASCSSASPKTPVPANYWDEADYRRHHVDEYWNNSPNTQTNDVSSYWQEASHKVTASDRYWAMTTVV